MVTPEEKDNDIEMFWSYHEVLTMNQVIPLKSFRMNFWYQYTVSCTIYTSDFLHFFEDHMGKEALTMNEDTDSKDADITFFAEYNNEDKKCVLKFPHQFFTFI